MINSLARLRYWQLAAIGLVSSITILVLLAELGRWARDTWPAAGEGIGIAYLIVASVLAWAIVGVFIEAAFHKHRVLLALELLDDVMDSLAGYVRSQPMDLDELAEELGLTKKEDNRG